MSNSNGNGQRPAHINTYVLGPSSICKLDQESLLGIPLAMDQRGIVYAHGAPIFRYLAETNEIEFVDRNLHRCDQRGTRFVCVSLADLEDLAAMNKTLIDNGPPTELQTLRRREGNRPA